MHSSNCKYESNSKEELTTCNIKARQLIEQLYYYYKYFTEDIECLIEKTCKV